MTGDNLNRERLDRELFNSELPEEGIDPEDTALEQELRDERGCSDRTS
jgi:hypothetical protein